MQTSYMTGMVLFAHGSRDGRWAEPFRAIAERVRGERPELPLRLAFLELMEPDLASAVAALVQEGVRRVVVVPIFLGQGGHLRNDLPRLARAVADEHPEVEVVLAGPAGEDPDVLEALAAFAVRATEAQPD